MPYCCLPSVGGSFMQNPICNRFIEAKWRNTWGKLVHQVNAQETRKMKRKEERMQDRGLENKKAHPLTL